MGISEYRPMGKTVNCPHCDQPNNAHCRMGGEFLPLSPKDIIFCFSCGGLGIYTDTLEVRRATAEEKREYDQRAEIISARRAMSYTGSARLARALLASWS